MSESDKSGKPELTAPNRARYEVYMQLAGEDSRVVWDNQYERKLKPKEVVKLLNSGCAAQARIAELEAQTWPKWNKISDGLPDNGLLVNYFTADGLIGLGYCYMSSVNPDFTPMWSDLNDENPIEKNITHWIRVTPPNNF